MAKNALKLIISTDNNPIISSCEDFARYFSSSTGNLTNSASITTVHLKVMEYSHPYNIIDMLNNIANFAEQMGTELNIISIEIRVENFNRGYASILSKIPTLTELSISCSNISNLELACLSQFKSLKKLSVDISKSTQKSRTLHYFSQWKWQPTLSHLRLRGFEIQDKTILYILKQFPNIISLDLTGSLVTEEGAGFLAYANLEDLIVDSQLIKSNNIRVLSKNIVLKSLGLDHATDLVDPTTISIDTAQTWTKNKNLKELSLRSATLDEGVIGTISKMPIKSLSLKGVANFKEDPQPSWLSEIHHLANHSHLRELNVGELYIYKFGEISLKLLLNNKNIRHLYLDNHVSSYDEEAKLPDYIITALESLQNLELLSLRNVSFGDLTDKKSRNFSKLVNALAKSNSIRHLFLEEMLMKEFPLLLTLTRLESLSVEYIYGKLKSQNISTNEVEAYFQQNTSLQKFECEKITMACMSIKVFKPDENFIQFNHFPKLTSLVSKVLEKNRTQRSNDLQEYLNKYVNLILECLNKHSYLSYLPQDLIKVIFYSCVTSDNLIWKTLEQRLQLIECLIEGMLKSASTETYTSHHIKVVEKYCHGENIFTFLHCKSLSVNPKKHPRDEFAVELNTPPKRHDAGYSI